MFNDLYLSSRAIYWSFAMGVIYSFAFIYLMSAFAETIAWICVALIQLGLIGAAIAGWVLRSNSVESSAGLTGEALKNAQNSQNGLLVVTIVFGILALGFACCVFCGFSSLKLAIDVIDAAADFLATTKRIILVPVLYFFLTLIMLLIWIGAFAQVASMNEIKVDYNIPQAKDVVWEKKPTYMALYMLFGILWICAWLKYTSSFIVMVSAATYYFNSSAEQEGEAEVGLGFNFAYVYHSGSIAIGAFIIALIQFIRIVFMYLAEQAEKASGDNPAIKIIVACGACLLKCIEKICDYINQAAYAYMAVSGESFCVAAWHGFLLNVKHMLKFSFANMIAKVFIFLGKLAITVGNCFSLFFIMKNITHDTEEVSSLVGPVVVVGIVSYMTASIFLGLFDTAVLALMTCLAIDMDLHDGHPAFGPPTFHDSIGKIDSEKHHKVDDEMMGNEMS